MTHEDLSLILGPRGKIQALEEAEAQSSVASQPRLGILLKYDDWLLNKDTQGCSLASKTHEHTYTYNEGEKVTSARGRDALR